MLCINIESIEYWYPGCMSRLECHHISGPLVGSTPNLKHWGDQWRCSPFIAWPRLWNSFGYLFIVCLCVTLQNSTSIGCVMVLNTMTSLARKLECNLHLNKKWLPLMISNTLEHNYIKEWLIVCSVIFVSYKGYVTAICCCLVACFKYLLFSDYFCVLFINQYFLWYL